MTEQGASLWTTVKGEICLSRLLSTASGFSAAMALSYLSTDSAISLICAGAAGMCFGANMMLNKAVRHKLDRGGAVAHVPCP